VLLPASQKIPQNVDAGELDSPGRRRQRPNRKSVPLSQPVDGRAGHADPSREVVNFDDGRQLACEPSGIFPFPKTC
jgi:hypothetical protein